MSFPVLRVELKITRMEEINCEFDKKGKLNKDYVGIRTFADVNERTYKKAKEVLLKRFDEVMYYDYTINKKNLSKTELVNIKDFARPNYWINDLDSNRRYRPKKSLKSLIKNNSNNLHQQIRTNMIEKCVINNPLFESSKCVINNPLTILLSTTPKDPTNSGKIYSKKKEVKSSICKITGLNISMQKQSILLSHTGLKHYYKNDKPTFEQIKNKYLSSQWNKSDLQTQIKEIAHNIRNTISNQKIKQQRIYNPAQLNILNSLGI